MNDPNAERSWAITVAKIVCCCYTCIFCTRRTDADTEADLTRTTPRSRPRRHGRRSLPSTSSIMDVLYPSSYMATPPALPDPPSYFSGDPHPSAVQENYAERTEGTPLISPTTTTTAGETCVPSGHHDPIVEALPLMGVPSPGAPSWGVPPAQFNAPVVGLGIDVLPEAEPLPSYSHFDENPSFHPAASDTLRPYPHISFSPRAR